MKRDMNLIRQILLALESDQESEPEGYDEQTLAYHKALIVESGLAHGSISEVINGELYVFVRRLSWDGHEFLDAARDEAGWKNAMRKVSTTIGTTSLPVLQALLIDYAKSVVFKGS